MVQYWMIMDDNWYVMVYIISMDSVYNINGKYNEIGTDY